MEEKLKNISGATNIPPSYYRKIKMWLDRYADKLQNKGKVRVNLKELMRWFGDQDIKRSSFISKQRRYLEVINREESDKGWIYYCKADITKNIFCYTCRKKS